MSGGKGKAPEQIDGRRHKRDDHDCHCGCARSEERTGTLVQNTDTRKLIELGEAIYEFPADRHPTADFPRAALQVCYQLDELKTKLPGGEIDER